MGIKIRNHHLELWIHWTFPLPWKHRKPQYFSVSDMTSVKSLNILDLPAELDEPDYFSLSRPGP